MSSDMATLGFEVDSRPVKTATGDVDKFGRQGVETDRKLKGATDNINKSFGGISRSVKIAGAAIAAFTVVVTATAGAALGRFVSATVEAEKVQAQLGAAIASTGGAAGKSLAALNSHAASLQKITTYGDETINAMQGVLLTFTAIKGDEFDKATEAVLDMATALGKDLQSSALQVGKALNDPVKGMSAMSEAGVQFTASQIDAAKALVKLGDVAGAQAIILAELEKQFGGSAEAARGALGGALDALGAVWGDVFELSTEASAGLRLAVESLIETVSEPKFVASIQSIGAALFAMAEVGFKGISLLVDNIDILGSLLTVTALKALPTAAAGFYTLAGGMGAATLSAGLLAIAMNAIPFVAAVSALVIVYRAYRDLGDTTGVAAAVTDTLKSSVDALNTALGVYATTASEPARKAAMDSARAMEADALATMANVEAKRALALQNGSSNKLFMESSNQPGGLMFDLNLQIIEVNRQLENARRTMQALGVDTDQVAESAGKVPGAIAEAGSEALKILATYQDQVAVQSMIKQFGEDSVAVSNLRLQIDQRILAEKLDELNIVGEIRTEILDSASAAGRLAQENSRAAGEARNVAAAAESAAAALGLALGNANGLSGALGIASAQAANLSSFLSSLPGALAGAQANIAGLQAGIAAMAKTGTVASGEIAKYRAELVASLPPMQAMQDGQREFVQKSINEKVALREQELALQSQYQNSAAAINKVATASAGAGKAFAGAGKSASGAGKAAKEAMSAATKATDEAKRAAESYAEELDRPVLSAIDGVAGAFGDFVSNGLKDFKSFAASVLDSFKRMIAQMISFAVANRIKVALGIDVPGMSGGASGGGILGGIGKLLGGSKGGKSGESGGAFGGIGSFLSKGFGGKGFLGLGGGSGLLGLGKGSGLAGIFSGGAAGAGGGLMAALGPIAAIGGVVMGLLSAMKRNLKDVNIVGAFGKDGFAGAIEEYLGGNLFSGAKIKKKALDEGTQTALDDAFNEIKKSVLDMSAVLGIGAEGLASFSYKFQVSIKGLDKDAQLEAIQGELKNMGSALAESVMGTKEYIRHNEDALEALERMSSALALVNDSMDLLGHNLAEVSLAGGNAASVMVDILGGLQAYESAVGAYFQNFHNDAERLAIMTRRLSNEFDDLGLSMPGTRAEFRALIESLDTATLEGQMFYAEMLKLSGAFAAVTPQLALFTAEMLGMLSSANGEIDALIQAANTNVAAVQQSARLWYRVADTLRELLAEMRQTSLGGGSSDQVFAAQRGAFNSAVIAGRGGDIQALQDLPGLARQYLTGAMANAGSALEYSRVANQVKTLAQEMAGTAEIYGANDDILVTLYREQISIMEALKNFLMLDGITSADLEGLDQGLQDLVADFGGTVTEFEGALGSIAALIDDTRAFDLQLLRERLSVTVDILPSANIPKYLQNLIAQSAEGITSTIEFIVRDDALTPDLRWLALNAASQHIATLDFVVNNRIAPDVLKLAITNTADLNRTLILALKNGLTRDEMLLVTTGNADLARVVNITIGSQIPAIIKVLALENIGAYTAVVSASLHPSFDPTLRRVVLEGQGAYVASVTAAINDGDLTVAERRILLTQQGFYTAVIGAVISSDMPEWQRTILANAASSAIRAVTISAVFSGQLTPEIRAALAAETELVTKTIRAFVGLPGITPDQMLALSMQNANASKTITASVTLPGLTADQLTALRAKSDTANKTISAAVKLVGLTPDAFIALRQKTESVLKTINATVNTSGLSVQQRSLLAAITGGSANTLTLGGAFTFDPSSAFSVLLEGAIRGPVTSLQSSFGPLRSALIELRVALKSSVDAYLVSAAAMSGLVQQNAIGSLQSKLEELSGQNPGNAKPPTITSTSDLWRADADYPTSTTVTLSDGASFTADSRGGRPGRQDATRQANDYINSAVLQSDDYDAWVSQMAALRGQITTLGGVPAFANGTDFAPGGMSWVGEKGPELVNLPRGSQVYTNQQSKQMADNSRMATEVAELRRVMVEVVKNTKRASDIARKHDVDGMPPVRT